MFVPSTLYDAVTFAPRIESHRSDRIIAKRSLVLRIQQWKSFADNQDESQNRQHKQSEAYGIEESIHTAIVTASRRPVLGIVCAVLVNSWETAKPEKWLAPEYWSVFVVGAIACSRQLCSNAPQVVDAT